MIQVFYGQDPPLGLKEASQVAQVVIAIASLFLAGYIFLYRRNRDQKHELQASILAEQNIKLQLFQELIVKPYHKTIMSFFENIDALDVKIQSNDLTEEDRQELISFVKGEFSVFRKSFIDLLYGINHDFGRAVQDIIDKLLDSITVSIFNNELKLKNPTTYDREIRSIISRSRNSLLSLIYNYRAT